jgi:hypothetical protein
MGSDPKMEGATRLGFFVREEGGADRPPLPLTAFTEVDDKEEALSMRIWETRVRGLGLSLLRAQLCGARETGSLVTVI